MQTFNERSILVTGTSGFLGGLIAGYLRKRGARVVGIARSRLAQSSEEVVYLDLQNSSDLKLLDTRGPYDEVIHCAA